MISVVQILTILWSPLVASFIQLTADRKGFGESAFSQCDNCKKRLRWYALIPIIGYFLIRGKCSCGYKIPVKYPVWELFFTALWIILVTTIGINSWLLLVWLVMYSVGMLIALWDYLYYEVPLLVYFLFIILLSSLNLSRLVEIYQLRIVETLLMGIVIIVSSLIVSKYKKQKQVIAPADYLLILIITLIYGINIALYSVLAVLGIAVIYLLFRKNNKIPLLSFYIPVVYIIEAILARL